MTLTDTRTHPTTHTSTENALEGKERLSELKVYVVSDVHLNNHPNSTFHEKANAMKGNFYNFLNKLNTMHDDAQHRLVLILNGDIMDLTGSWFGAPMPWDDNKEAIEHKLICIIQDILDNNQAVVTELQALLHYKNAEIVYCIGNHDGILADYPAAREYLIRALQPGHVSRRKIHIVDQYELPEIGLFVQHGHTYDRFNRRGNKAFEYPIGDYINILLINLFVDKMLERLSQEGFSQLFIDAIHHKLVELENLRPISLIPLWVQNLSDEYAYHPLHKEIKEAKGISLEDIIHETVEEILDNEINRPLAEKLKMAQGPFRFLLRMMLRMPGSFRMISYIFSLFHSRGSHNKRQHEVAQKLHQQKKYRFLVMGHTHHPAVQPLDHDSYYFNTGSWKPVIFLFKFFSLENTVFDPMTPMPDFASGNLQPKDFAPKVQFSKVEYSGVLQFEKNLLEPRSDVRFSLKTIQSNMAVSFPSP